MILPGKTRIQLSEIPEKMRGWKRNLASQKSNLVKNARSGNEGIRGRNFG